MACPLGMGDGVRKWGAWEELSGPEGGVLVNGIRGLVRDPTELPSLVHL